MKKFIKIVSALLAVLILSAAALSGCSGKPTNGAQSSIALVIGAHKYNPKFTVSTQLSDTIYECARTYGNVSVTVSSGEPKTVANWSMEVERKDVGEAKLKQIAKANTEAVVSQIAQIEADNPEVDTLSAIAQATNNLAETNSEVKKLIVYDSGLTTTGYMDFTKPKLILSDVNSIVRQLKDKHAIPDLTGIEVVWYGIGQVRGKQPKIDSDNLYRVKNLWQATINAGNPASLTFVDAELTSEYEDDSLPDVSLVNFPSDELELSAEEPEQKVFLQLTEEKLSFKSNTAEFADPDSASDTLDSVAKILTNSDESNVYIIGSTSTYGPHDSSITLSEQRAKKVKDELVNRGVTIQLISVGIGDTPCDLRTDDTDDKGNLIEEQAKQNRAVFIISENSNAVSALRQEGLL